MESEGYKDYSIHSIAEQFSQLVKTKERREVLAMNAIINPLIVSVVIPTIASIIVRLNIADPTIAPIPNVGTPCATENIDVPSSGPDVPTAATEAPTIASGMLNCFDRLPAPFTNMSETYSKSKKLSATDAIASISHIIE